MDRTDQRQAGSPASAVVAGSRVASGCDEPASAPLIKGIDQFNEGRYWECHETLERLWRAEPRPLRDLYQGILQVGVGLHHLRNGNYYGAVKVLGRGLVRLEGVPEQCQGVLVALLHDAARSVFEEILEMGPDRAGDLDVKRLPHIELAR
jgi:hypothetical protein